MSPHAALASLLAASLGLAACVGRIGDGASDEALPDGLDPLACHAGPDATSAPMRRLTRDEFNHAVRDLLGDESRPADDFLADEIVGGFDANAVAAVDQSVLEDYHLAAEDIARRAISERRDRIADCEAADTACVHQAILVLARRAFRRSLSGPIYGEVGRSLTDLYDDALTTYSHDEALELVVQAVLLSPHFLYHVELSVPGEGETVVALDDFELASRLSFFVWASVPDDRLLDAAETGALTDDPEALAAEVRRMLDDPRAEASLASFHAQWLGIDRHGRLEDRYKDGDVFPAWSPALAASMRAETAAFVNHVVAEGGSLRTLLTADYSFVDDELAGIYGVSAPGSPEPTLVSLPAERAGLLTQPGVLAAQAHAAKASWVLRGKMIREQFLCEELPPPPPDVDGNETNDPDRLTHPECSYCHQLMDPIGFGFDGFDALGQTVEADTDGHIRQGNEELRFDGVRDLAETLADMERVRRCYAKQWFQYATRRAAGPADQCAVDAIGEAFASSDGDIRDLIVAVASSDGFRFRRGETP